MRRGNIVSNRFAKRQKIQCKVAKCNSNRFSCVLTKKGEDQSVVVETQAKTCCTAVNDHHCRSIEDNDELSFASDMDSDFSSDIDSTDDGESSRVNEVLSHHSTFSCEDDCSTSSEGSISLSSHSSTFDSDDGSDIDHSFLTTHQDTSSIAHDEKELLCRLNCVSEMYTSCKSDKLSRAFDTSRFEADSTYGYRTCRNCFRSGHSVLFQSRTQSTHAMDELDTYIMLHMVNLPKSDLRSGRCKFSNLRKPEIADRVWVCWQCYNVVSKSAYELREKQTVNGMLYGWPAFMWSLLCHNSGRSAMEIKVMWSVVPQNFRSWWLGSMERKPHFVAANCSLDNPVSLVKDATFGRQSFDVETKNLKAVSLFKCFDDYCALPLVKCPWGCSEFVNRCNGVPFDVVYTKCLEEHIGFCPKELCSDKKLLQSMGDSFRSDFLFGGHLILENPSWLCCPRLCFDSTRGPQFLSCRFHSKLTKRRYIHVPSNPISTIASRGDNQFALTVPKPRVSSAAHFKKFSNSYQTAVINSRYDGIDTMVMGLTGRHDTSTVLSSIRDLCQMNYRPDVMNHVNLLRRKGDIRREQVRNMKRDARSIASDSTLLNSMVTGRLIGANFVSLEDAMRLHGHMRSSTEHKVKLTSGKFCWFKPSWQPLLFYVHPCTAYGSKVPAIPHMKSKDNTMDMRLVWVIIAALTSSTVLWRSTSECVTKEADWKGWFLHVSADTCTRNAKCQGSKNNPFKEPRKLGSSQGYKGNQYERLNKLVMENYQLEFPYTFRPAVLCRIFQSMGNILVLDWCEFCENGAWGGLNVRIHSEFEAIIFYQDVWGGIPNQHPTLRWKNWELKSAIKTSVVGTTTKFKGENFVRHGSGCGSEFWHRTHGEKQGDMNNNTTKCYREFLDWIDDAWDVVIYENIAPKQVLETKVNYLQCTGFQVKLRCRHHKMPLVPSPQVDANICMECGKRASVICNSIYNNQERCSVAVCKKHEKQWNENEQSIVYLDESEQQVPVPRRAMAVVDREEIDDSASEQSLDRRCSGNLSISDDGMITFDNLRVEDHVPDAESPGHQRGDHMGFPTTHAGMINCGVNWTSDTVPSHVIFNKFGRMLIRKDRKLTPTQKQKFWLQSVISNGCSNSVPLVYAEATVFPSVFWYGKNDGSIPGALPTALLTDNNILSQLNFATVHDHMRTRIMDCSLLTSSDVSYKLFGLDACLNLGSRGNDTRINMRRGWDAMATTGEGVKVTSHDSDPASQIVFQAEQLENSIVCDKIAAALQRRMATLFVTFTLNQCQHFGMRLLKNWLDSEECASFLERKRLERFTDSIGYKITEDDREKMRMEILSSSSTLAMRMWENVWHVFRLYLVQSPEKPLGGTVIDLVDRSELQDQLKAGNLPHHHMIVWLEENDGTHEARMKIVEKIRGSIMHLVDAGEVEGLLQDGVASSFEALVKLLGMFETFLPHNHTRRCMIPTQKEGLGNREVAATGSLQSDIADLVRQGYRCKVVDNHRISEDRNRHTFRKLQRPHCARAKEIFYQLGLMWTEENMHGERIEVLHDWLVAETHVPPTTAEHQCVSPVLARLALLNPSNGNVQYLDSILAARYLTKYVIKIDEANRVFVQVPTTKNPDTFTFQPENIPNTKITSVAIDQKLQQKKKSQCIARVIGDPEVTMLLLNMESVHMTMKFVHISTVPMEERPAFDRSMPIGKLIKGNFVRGTVLGPADLNTASVILSEAVRESWAPGFRRFKNTAIMQAKDECFSPLTIDSVTVFSVRPPELYFVRSQKVYHECFERKPIKLQKQTGKCEFEVCLEYCQELINETPYRKCCWIDATFHRIRVRAPALRVLNEYIDSCTDKDFSATGMNNAGRIIKSLFRFMSRGLDYVRTGQQFSPRDKIQWENCCNRFLTGVHDRDYPIAYYSNIKPKLSNRFLIHVLLSMGKFTSELDLTLSGSIRSAFIKAELFDPQRPRESVDGIVKRYLLEQIPAHCSSTKGSDDTLVRAYDVLTQALIHNNHDNSPNGAGIGDNYPSVMYTRLVSKASNDVYEFINNHRMKLSQFLVNELTMIGLTDLPTPESVASATFENFDSPVWNSSMVERTSGQPEESFLEQKRVLVLMRKTVRSLLLNCHNQYAKSICTVGGPGCGKTEVNKMGLLDAMCRGFRCVTTALLSDRANQLAGIHVHRLFCLPHDISSMKGGVGQIAEAAIRNLYSYGLMFLHLLKVTDVLFIDEFGQWPAKYIAIIDIILRRIRDSNVFLGGILVKSTYDIFQLLPINEIPPLLSGHMMTSFRFVELTHSVRAANDPELRELNQLTRLAPNEYTPEKIERVKFLIKTICTFVDSFDDERIPPNTMFVFGKKEPGRLIRDRILRGLETSLETPSRIAEDSESTYAGDWKSASISTSGYLDNKVKEDRTLHFSRRLVYQTTEVNGKKYNSNELCVIWDVPSQDHLDNFKPVPVLLAPPGTKCVPPLNEIHAKDDLLAMGWREEAIECCRESTVPLRNRLKGRRKQYAMRLHVTCTLHVAMGATYTGVCSKVEKDPSSIYALWERAQAIVLLSRTKLGNQIYFVGDPDETADAIVDVLLSRSQYFEYMRHILDAFLNESDTETPEVPVIQLSEHPFRPIDVELPTDESGFCYLLGSLAQPDATYIGETTRLGPRIDEHNSGSGAIQTASVHLRKWALLCFVSGFDYRERERKNFEAQWEHRRDNYIRVHRRNPTTEEIIQMAVTLATNHSLCSLRVVVCSKRIA